MNAALGLPARSPLPGVAIHPFIATLDRRLESFLVTFLRAGSSEWHERNQ